MNVESTKSAISFFKDLTSTKHGMYVALVILLTGAFCVILWLVNGQRVMAIEERKEALHQVELSHEREKRIKDDCAEEVKMTKVKVMNEYFEAFEKLKAMAASSVNYMQATVRQTDQVIAQQKEIIYKANNDETN